MEKLLENFSKNSRTQREYERGRESAMTILLNMLAMLFSKTFSKLRERLTESDCANCGGGGCRVRNVKVHCFIEENGEKLFGRADAKLSNSLLVEKIR